MVQVVRVGVYLLIYVQWRSGGVNNIPQGDTACATVTVLRTVLVVVVRLQHGTVEVLVHAGKVLLKKQK